jgi:uncharacterized membrane protein YqjE
MKVDPPSGEAAAGTETVTATARPEEVPNAEGSLRPLLRQLADDSRDLIRQEVDLARLELQASVRTLATNAVMLVLGMAMLLVGLLVLTAFLVLGLGRLLAGEYWLSSLIVGAILAAIGGGALFAGRKGLKGTELKPTATAATLRENREWVRAEVEQIKREMRPEPEVIRDGGHEGTS